MIKLFRKIRQNLLTEGKTTKYFKYAIGEIVLVVIGILLALQINVWNKEHTAKKQLKEIYKQIYKDLVIDTTQIGQIVSAYKEKDQRIQNILDKNIKKSFYDTITSLNYKDCSICFTESTNYYPIETITKGYKLLKDSGEISTTSKDSLPDYIDEFYTIGTSQIERQLKVIENITFENIKDFEHYSWYIDWAEGRYNKDFLTFIFESETYRKKLARYKLYYKRNYIRSLRNYKEYAGEILNLIELELEK